MTRKSKRELERALEGLGGGSEAGLVVLGEGNAPYPTPSEYEAEHGHPPSNSDALVIRLPSEVTEY